MAAWWAIFQPPCRILAIFGNSEVLTLDVCCGKNMTSPEFRRSQVLSMGSVLNILSDITQIFLGTSGNQPFSQKISFFETNFTGKSNEKYAFGVLFMIFLLSPTNWYVILWIYISYLRYFKPKTTFLRSSIFLKKILLF